MNDVKLWDHDDPVRSYGHDVPRWIQQDITPADVAAIVQGGCESGAYMPAVTYLQAVETMAKYGNDVLDYIASSLGELPRPDNSVSWSGLAVHYLATAVEIWAVSVEYELLATIEDLAT